MYHQNDRYQQNGSAGAKWFFIFLLVIVILAIVFVFGLNVAGQIYEQRIKEFEQQKEDLNLQNLELQTKLQAEILETQKREVARQVAELGKDFRNILNAGLMLFFATASIPLPVWLISKVVNSQKLGTASVEQAQQPSQPVQQARRKPSPAAQKAREVERLTGQKQPNHIEFLYTRPFWPEDDTAEGQFPGNYPLAN